MVRAALLITVTLLLAGVTRGHKSLSEPGRDDTGAPDHSIHPRQTREHDIYKREASEHDIHKREARERDTTTNPLENIELTASESRSQATVARQSLAPPHDQNFDLISNPQRPFARRRPGGRRRRILDPEKRRQLILRRQRLGLPIRERFRQLLMKDQVEETPLASTTSPAPETSSVRPRSTTTTTTPRPVHTSTSTSTSSSFSSSSVSSSSSTSTTSRSIFPSFSVASKLRENRNQNTRISGGDGWGLKTNSRHDESEEEQESSVSRTEADTPSFSSRGLTARRRGVSKILQRPRPLHQIFSTTTTPAPVTTPTTTPRPTTTTNEPTTKRDKRLRYRPTLVGKKRRDKAKLTDSRRLRQQFYEQDSSAYEQESRVVEQDPTTVYNTDSIYTTEFPVYVEESSLYRPDPSFQEDPEDYEEDPIIYEQEAPFYEEDPPIYIPQFTSPKPQPRLHRPQAHSRSPKPFFIATDPPSPFRGGTPKPRHTPVPKKVSLSPFTTTTSTIRSTTDFYSPEIYDDDTSSNDRDIFGFTTTEDQESIQRDEDDRRRHSFRIHDDQHETQGNNDGRTAFRFKSSEESQEFVPSFNEEPNPFSRQVFQERPRALARRRNPNRSRTFERNKVVEVNQGNVFERDQGDVYIPDDGDNDQVYGLIRDFDAVSVPVYKPTQKYTRNQLRETTTESIYDPEEIFASDPAFRVDSDPSFESIQNYTPTPVFTDESDPLFQNEAQIYRSTTPDYRDESDQFYDSLTEYSPRPLLQTYDSDPLYDTELIYAPGQSYTSDGDYEDKDYDNDDDDDDKPGVLDQYKYGYNVESEDTGNYQERYEARDGATVSGSYKVALPDGRVQVVTYVADDNGFRAEVTYEGEENTPAAPTTPDTPPPPRAPLRPAPQRSHPRPHPHTRDPEPSPIFSHHNTESTLHHAREPEPTLHHAREPEPTLHHAREPEPTLHHAREPQPTLHHPREPQPTLHNAPKFTPRLVSTRSSTPKPLPSHHFRKKLRFHEHVTTPSPNPFRLVVERSRASTLAPPPPTTRLPPPPPPSTRPPPPPPPATRPPRPTFTPTNAHMIDNGFLTSATRTRNSGPTPRPPPPHTRTQQHTPHHSLRHTTPTPSHSLRHTTPSHSLRHTTRSPSLRHSKSSHSHSLRHTTPAPPPRPTTPEVPTTTNGHTIIPPHASALRDSSSPPTSTPVYHYKSQNRPHSRPTTLYTPTTDSTAYIHTLGRTHSVPVLLPYPLHHTTPSPFHQQPRPTSHLVSNPTHPNHSVLPTLPRTYYLNQQGHLQARTHHQRQVVDSVEIVRGDDTRPRLSLKLPEPHQTDIYPAPPRPLP